MAPNKVILLACGSFNPPTNMHLRMFEIARDSLNRLGQYLVIGGIISPVHDAYSKKELVPSFYRCEMVKLALRSSDWIQISDWESSQESWSRTTRVLQHHQNLLNSVLNYERDSPNNNLRNDLENGYDNCCSWITNDIKNTEGPVQIKLLCGADLLESFATPGLWSEEDIETIIGQHGIVVITRQGSDPQRFIYESDLLTKYQYNIIIVTEWITNDVSSTKVRRALRRQESVKYLLEDSVIEFIKKNGLYGSTKNDFKYKTNANINLNVPVNTYILTPSPSDIHMSLSSSGNDIYLNLNPIPNENQTVPDFSGNDTASSQKTFQSTAEITFLSSSKKKIGEGKIVRQAEIDMVNVSEKSSTISPERKKVGFAEKESEDGKKIQKGEIPEGGRIYRKLSEKNIKYSSGKKITKADSERNEMQTVKGDNLFLRRSQSDALMAKKAENGETASVKIQFTKEGIKVISDKESIV